MIKKLLLAAAAVSTLASSASAEFVIINHYGWYDLHSSEAINKSAAIPNHALPGGQKYYFNLGKGGPESDGEGLRLRPAFPGFKWNNYPYVPGMDWIIDTAGTAFKPYYTARLAPANADFQRVHDSGIGIATYTEIGLAH